MSIKSYLVFSSTETYYQIRQAVILFVSDTAEYCYRLVYFKINWNSSGHFDQKDNRYLKFIIFVSDQLNYFTHFSSVPEDAMSINILNVIEMI